MITGPVDLASSGDGVYCDHHKTENPIVWHPGCRLFPLTDSQRSRTRGRRGASAVRTRDTGYGRSVALFRGWRRPAAWWRWAFKVSIAGRAVTGELAARARPGVSGQVLEMSRASSHPVVIQLSDPHPRREDACSAPPTRGTSLSDDLTLGADLNGSPGSRRPARLIRLFFFHPPPPPPPPSERIGEIPDGQRLRVYQQWLGVTRRGGPFRGTPGPARVRAEDTLRSASDRNLSPSRPAPWPLPTGRGGSASTRRGARWKTRWLARLRAHRRH